MKLRVVSYSHEFSPALGASQRDAAALAAAASAVARVEAYASRPPRVAVMGEFNTGKSSLINMLVGRKAVPTGILTRTSAPRVLRYGKGAGILAFRSDGEQEAPDEIMLGCDILQRVELLDTPAADDAGDPGGRVGDGVTGRYLADVHGVIWCTLATQAWKDSERRRWLGFPPALRQNSILAVTHADSLCDCGDRQRVLERLRDEAGGLFGHILLLSIPMAMRAYNDEGQIEDRDQWRESGAELFGAALSSVIDGIERQRCEISARAAQRITQSVLSKLHSIDLSGEPTLKREQI